MDTKFSNSSGAPRLGRRAPGRASTLLLSACSLAPIGAFAQSDEPSPVATVVVTAEAVAEQTRQQLQAEQALNPGGVTLVDSDDLYQRNVSNLADMLRYVPGVWAASGSTGDSTFFSSRGSNLDATNYDGNGIKLLQDGLPVTTADGNNHNRIIDPLAARYISVARGANALTYGASTLGGAIDFTTPTARDSAPELYLSGGSFGQVQGHASVGTVNGPFDGLITAEGRSYDGYRDHQQQERKGIYANSGWQFSEALRTRFYLTYLDNDQELPGSLTREQWQDDPRQAEAAAVAGDYHYNVQTWRFANKTVWDIGADSHLSVGVSYEDQQLYHPIVYAPPYFSLLIDTRQRTAGTSLRYDLRLGDHQLLAGVDYSETTNKGGNYDYEPGQRGALQTDVDNRADSVELFAVDRWQFAPKWTVIYGTQGVVSSRDVKNTDAASGVLTNPNDHYNSINPRVGLIHQLTPDVQLFANLSRLYEAPDNFELQDDACGCDKALDPMRGTVAEIGTRGSQPFGDKDRWHWDVAVYYAKLQDEILSIDDPDAPGTSLSANIDDTIHAGIEALFGASLALDAAGSHRIEPLVNITVNHFKFDGDEHYGDNDLPAAPTYAIKGELLYRHTSGFYAGPTFDVVGSRWADFSNRYKVDSYELLGLRAGLTRETWEVYAELRNLSDKNYVAFFSVKDAAAPDDAILTPGEPRALYVGTRLRF
ncbi:TonB-dependent receptor family protein [Solimonas soli]|uniref:TonB-dependent receptor family protein n=1 Tax=Solimonas soli TaxID=413479 RepID=UPI0004B1AB91|nr:TonB-dependent receptor [Solimonas soli]